MPRAGWTKPDADHRLSDHVAFAVLTRVFPPAVVDEVIAEVGRQQRRTRMLPSRIVVYYVLGLALFSQSSYDQVIRLLVAGQSWSSGWSQEWPVPSKAALYKARTRLGHEPLQLLFDRMALPFADPESTVAFYRGRRLLGLDAATIVTPATTANTAEFAEFRADERVDAVDSPPGPPAVQILGLTELATGAIVGAAVGAQGSTPHAVAAELLPKLGPGHLLLGAAALYSPALWAQAAATGADLLWELPDDATFEAGDRHSDGSFSAQICTPSDPVTQARTALGARIVEHRHNQVVSEAAPRRFLTTLHDPRHAPAAELLGVISHHRSLGSAFDEFRAQRNSPPIVLRSKNPPGVRQEVYGYLCVHYAIRRTIAGTASSIPSPPRIPDSNAAGPDAVDRQQSNR
jgi:hypothetical protein